MDKQRVRSFVSGLIEEIDHLGQVYIWDRSISIKEDEKEHNKKITRYREKLNNLLESDKI